MDIFVSEFRDRPLEYYVRTMLGEDDIFADRIRKMP